MKSALTKIAKMSSINKIIEVSEDIEDSPRKLKALLCLAWFYGAHHALWWPENAFEMLSGSKESYELAIDTAVNLVIKGFRDFDEEELQEVREIFESVEAFKPITRLEAADGPSFFHSTN